MKLHRLSTQAAIAFLVLFSACSKPKDNPLEKESTASIREAIGKFESFVETWEKRVSDGSWERKVSDGSWVELVPESQREGADPKTFPAKRIDEFKTALEKFRAELRRRGL